MHVTYALRTEKWVHVSNVIKKQKYVKEDNEPETDESEIVLSHDTDINFTEIYRRLRTSQHS